MLVILFFVAGVIGFFYNPFTGQFEDAAALLVICGILIFFARWVAKEKEHAVEFLKWIKSKEEDLKKGWA